MSKIVDLKGSVWYLNDYPAFSWTSWYNIDFVSNGEQFVAMSDKRSETSNIHDCQLKYFYANGRYVTVINGGTEEWVNQNYRTVEITGGADSANPTLIALMYEMGTLVSGGVLADPNFTLDLSTLNLSAGTHSITVKLSGEGYRDSEHSNAVQYTVKGETVIGNLIFAQTSTWYSERITRNFEVGMTWGEFLASSYNAVQDSPTAQGYIRGQFFLKNGGIYFTGYMHEGNYTSPTMEVPVLDVTVDDLIISDYSYRSSYGGGGN